MILLLIIASVAVVAYGYLFMARIDAYVERGGFVTDEQFERGQGEQRMRRGVTLAEHNGAEPAREEGK